jgi:hypothetical protein
MEDAIARYAEPAPPADRSPCIARLDTRGSDPTAKSVGDLGVDQVRNGAPTSSRRSRLGGDEGPNRCSPRPLHAPLGLTEEPDSVGSFRGGPSAPKSDAEHCCAVIQLHPVTRQTKIIPKTQRSGVFGRWHPSGRVLERPARWPPTALQPAPTPSSSSARMIVGYLHPVVGRLEQHPRLSRRHHHRWVITGPHQETPDTAAPIHLSRDLQPGRSWWGWRDSNPHCERFKRPASADWATPPRRPRWRAGGSPPAPTTGPAAARPATRSATTTVAGAAAVRRDGGQRKDGTTGPFPSGAPTSRYPTNAPAELHGAGGGLCHLTSRPTERFDRLATAPLVEPRLERRPARRAPVASVGDSSSSGASPAGRSH